jgi:sterol desaturase/sphingolipid hydroxylase (fatty acid hydroxylase superfamily)
MIAQAAGGALGLLYANVGEWWVHKILFHRIGRRRGTLPDFHHFEHHPHARRNGMIDPDYQRSVFGWHAQGKEMAFWAVVAVGHAPVALVWPSLVGGLYLSVALFYVAHKRAHTDPAWARRWLPWHYDHHMGPNPEANFCVTFPWFDHVMGTRVPYVGTAREADDVRRRA